MTALLELHQITKTFRRKAGPVERIASMISGKPKSTTLRAVTDFSLAVKEGEVVGLVGESGCGKSTVGRVAAGLHQPDTGVRSWQGRPFDTYPGSERTRNELAIQMIFQDPYASLNPRMRVRDIVSEGARVHKLRPARELAELVPELFEQVGLNPQLADRFPHEFSGGQRARIGIARALSVNPRFLICDESVAALDVSIQAQILNLFIELRRKLGLTYLFISHDLGVVRHISDRLVVMYLGRIVEIGSTEDVYREPRHPYTRALLAEIPSLTQRKKTFRAIKGEIASPLNPPSGCHFHPRCPMAQPICQESAPALRNNDDTPTDGYRHAAACHFA